MGLQVMIICPNTQKPVNVGMKLQPSDYYDKDFKDETFTCPACHQVHTWSKVDSFPQGQEPPKKQ